MGQRLYSAVRRVAMITIRGQRGVCNRQHECIPDISPRYLPNSAKNITQLVEHCITTFDDHVHDYIRLQVDI